MVFRLVQERDGVPLAQSWDGSKIKQVTTKLGELLECDASEVISRLTQEGVTLQL